MIKWFSILPYPTLYPIAETKIYSKLIIQIKPNTPHNIISKKGNTRFMRAFKWPIAEPASALTKSSRV